MSYLGYKLHPESRDRLLHRFPAVHPEVVAHHVTTDLLGKRYTAFRPEDAHVEVIGHAANSLVQAAVLRVNGKTHRDDGEPFHVTLSVNRKLGGSPKDSKELIRQGYGKVDPFTIQAEPEYFQEEVTPVLSKYDHVIRAVQDFTGLKPYLVGGAVRDAMLGKPSKDTDLVVVGGHDKLHKLGFKPIKKDFPVFTHPKFPGVEVALARGEKKTGTGHSGFDWHEAADLTTDLNRRDFTVNAMAYHPDDGVIDHHGGMSDLQNKKLRHVSDAFSEDPLRTFRAARFAAKLGFDVHPDTIPVLRATNPELPALSKERVRDEFSRAMMTKNPSRFFKTLKLSGSHEHWFPEAAHLKDSTMRALDSAAAGGASEEARHLVLTHAMSPETIKAFDARLGVGAADTARKLTHAKYSPMGTARHQSPDAAAEHWRAVRSTLMGPHLQALAHQGGNQVEHLKGLFKRLGEVRIEPQKGKRADVAAIRSTYAAAAAQYLKESVNKVDELIAEALKGMNGYGDRTELG